MSIAFLFTNPGHHLEAMTPVIGELRRRGHDTTLISLAELRGLDTPTSQPLKRAIPFRIRKRAGQPESFGVELRDWQKGARMQALVWRFGLGPRLSWLLRDADVVVIPNDIGFPYDRLIAARRRRKLRTVLLQEGIRFSLPARYTGPHYGTNGADLVCVWGEGSRVYFEDNGVPAKTLCITGTPRMDALDPAAWTTRGAELRSELGLAQPPIAYLSNPIETQHYGPKQLRLDCFERLLAAAIPILAERGLALVVKPHAGESAADYHAIVARSQRADLVHVLPTAPIFSVLAAARAAIVLSSTVGLEALLFGRALGALEIPGHGYPFEYVSQGAAVPIAQADLSRGVNELLERPPGRDIGARFVERHYYDRGNAYRHVADAILQLT
jgi:hypothetical protein